MDAEATTVQLTHYFVPATERIAGGGSLELLLYALLFANGY